MLHKAWSSIEEVPYCFSRSSIKFQGHAALKFVKFDPNWAFSDCNSSLNSRMAMKCCTKLETAKERCPIIFQGHTSNFKVTRDKTLPILTQIGRFRTIGRSQLSNPSDLPCFLSCLSLEIYRLLKILILKQGAGTQLYKGLFANILKLIDISVQGHLSHKKIYQSVCAVMACANICTCLVASKKITVNCLYRSDLCVKSISWNVSM